MLPTDAKKRKAIPIYSGFICYFPDAIAAVAELSQIGNDQHNPGKPLHWDRSKSQDELDALMRHTLDEAMGEEDDSDGVMHATKRAWRAMADLQKKIEKRRKREQDRTVLSHVMRHEVPSSLVERRVAQRRASVGFNLTPFRRRLGVCDRRKA